MKVFSVDIFQHFFRFTSVFCIISSAWFTLAVDKSAVIYFKFLLCLKNSLLFPLNRNFFSWLQTQSPGTLSLTYFMYETWLSTQNKIIIFPFLNCWISGTISVQIALEMGNPVGRGGSGYIFFLLLNLRSFWLVVFPQALLKNK